MTIDAQNSRSSNRNNSIVYCTSNNTANYAAPNIASSSHCDSQSRYETVYPNCDLDHPVNTCLLYDYPSPCYGIPFFINERKTHYSELNQFVFRPLASMAVTEMDTRTGDNFFNRLRLDAMVYDPRDIIHYGKALMHMQKDARTLPDQIESFFTCVSALNSRVDDLERLVNETIRNAFRKNPDSIVVEYYTYSFDNVRSVILSVWNQIMNENPQNISEAITNLPTSELKIEMKNNTIRLRGFLIVEEINDDEETAIIDIVLKIIKNETFIEQILGLIKDRTTLNNKMNTIRNRSNEISSMLESGTINKVKCCPTIWNLIEKYVL
jgi:hypothetical protein